MENDILKLYVNENYSINQLCEEFRVGKIKIRDILKKNNIPLKKRGGQKKHTIVDVDYSIYDNKSLKCVKTGKVINDILNKSGFVTTHLKKEYDLDIPSLYKRNMVIKTTGKLWYEKYFTVVDTVNKEQWVCPICNYTTNDLNNLGGGITKHIKQHKYYDLIEFNQKYPDSKVPLKFNKINIDDINTYISCSICKQPFRSITNTHLDTHNISIDEYKIKYGEIFSKNYLEDCSRYLDNGRENITQNFTSKAQNEINEYIQSLGFETLMNNKKLLKGVEIDIYIPSLNIGFEYNGLFWHSEKMGKTKNYHFGKQVLAKENDVKLFHIFSDEWLNNENIVKNRIKHLLGVSENKIYARKCIIKEISPKEKNDYLNKTHIQGEDKSKYKIGAYYDNRLVGVMTFATLRKSLGSNNKDNTYELVRYCSDNVVGLASKLLKFFVKKYNPNRIISYSDKRWSVNGDDNLYTKIGFTHLGQTKPNYWYSTGDNKRFHRFNFRKDILVKNGHDKNKTEKQIMSDLNYLLIWDCGSDRYELNL